MSNHHISEPIVVPETVAGTRPTIIVKTAVDTKAVKDKDFLTADAAKKARVDALRLEDSIENLSDSLHKGLDFFGAGNELDTNIGVHSIGDLEDAIEADYKGMKESNLILRINGVENPIAITHGNVNKVAKAFEEAAKVAKQIETKLKKDNGSDPLTDDQIFTQVNAALKASLKKDGIAIK